MRINHLPVIIISISLLAVSSQCKKKADPDSTGFRIIADAVKKNRSALYLNVSGHPEESNSLPIGVFDSGTGGLSVLNSILELDKFNNTTREPGSDGLPDFFSEKFIYLADEANMPYGRYDSEGKADFLRELVIKDVLFLMGNRYYLSPEKRKPEKDKQPVKSVVIACNTATAFGLEDARNAMDRWGLGVEILGIIEAGAKEAVDCIPEEDIDKAVVGILATEGTCASMSYPSTVKRVFSTKYPDKDIPVVQQAGIGLAGAIDGDINYLDPSISRVRSESEYFGPALGHPEYPIEQRLWDEYNFETGNCLLVMRNIEGEIFKVQLNSVTNYVRYMITHLVSSIADQYPDCSLDAIILGCTHYPFVEDKIRGHLKYLKSYSDKYRNIISDKVELIDPAESLGIELYKELGRNDLHGKNQQEDSKFFISVPNPVLRENLIDDIGEFPYSWKYGRETNSSLEYVKRVPFSESNIKPDVLERIKQDLPTCYSLITLNF